MLLCKERRDNYSTDNSNNQKKKKLETIVPQCFKNFDDSTESLGSRDGESSKTQEPYKATQVQES